MLERQRTGRAAKKAAAIRVHVATQPTFTRYVFDDAEPDRGYPPIAPRTGWF